MKRVLWWLGAVLVVIIALLAVAAAFIDEPLRVYAERAFNERLKGYTLRIGSLDFHPLGFSLDLERVTLVQDEHPDPPIATIPRWSASVHWRELLTGHVVSDHVIERPTLHITRPQAKQEARDDVSIEERGWQEAVLAVYPLDINRFRIVDADITYLDRPQAVPLRFTHLNFLAGNIRNIRTDGDIYPSDVHVDTQALGEGRITVDGFADFLSEPFMGIDADVRLEKVALDDLVSLVGRYNIQLRKGVISAIGHVEYSPYTQDVKIHELMLDGMRVDYVHSAGTGEHERQTGRQAARTAKKLSNHPDLLLKIDHAKILDSEFGFVNKAVAPEYRVFVTNLQMELENFSNQLREGTAFIKLTGKFMGSGETFAKGTFRPEKTSPDFDLNVRIVKTRMKSLNELLRAYGKFDVSEGKFSLYSELTVKNGGISGYVKPLFKDVDVYDPEQDRDKGLLTKMYERLIGGLTDVLKNEPREEVATQAEVSGPIKNPRANTWEMVVKLIQNAFFEAILPGFEEQVRTG